MITGGEKELTFMDLVVLQRIGPDTILERFGSKINSSFFEAANILGTIKLKGYVDLETTLGESKVNVSEAGKAVLALAEEKSIGEIDTLDRGILGAISKGLKDPDKLSERLNVRSGDLAYHLYKLVKTNHIDYDLRAGRVSVMLTESGFKDADRSGEEPESDSGVGEELAEAPKESEKREKKTDVGAERTKTKTVYYLKRWGKYSVLAGIIFVLLLLVLVYFYLNSKK
ncbi:MAG: hypothetical protein V1909_05255 [Candidatus Micrarchaeota archaeon]